MNRKNMSMNREDVPMVVHNARFVFVWFCLYDTFMVIYCTFRDYALCWMLMSMHSTSFVLAWFCLYHTPLSTLIVMYCTFRHRILHWVITAHKRSWYPTPSVQRSANIALLIALNQECQLWTVRRNECFSSILSVSYAIRDILHISRLLADLIYCPLHNTVQSNSANWQKWMCLRLPKYLQEPGEVSKADATKAIT